MSVLRCSELGSAYLGRSTTPEDEDIMQPIRSTVQGWFASSQEYDMRCGNVLYCFNGAKVFVLYHSAVPRVWTCHRSTSGWCGLDQNTIEGVISRLYDSWFKHELPSWSIVSNDTKWRTLSSAHVRQKNMTKSHDMIPVPSYLNLRFFFHEGVDLRSSGSVTGISSLSNVLKASNTSGLVDVAWLQGLSSSNSLTGKDSVP